MGKVTRAAGWVAALAHGMAWAAFLFILFYPAIYRGTATQIGPGGVSRVVPYNGTFLEVNGWLPVLPLAAPLVLTAAGLLAVLKVRTRRMQLTLVWLAWSLLLIFTGLGMFSIGMFYLPAVLTLLAAAAILSMKGRQDARATESLHHQQG